MAAEDGGSLGVAIGHGGDEFAEQSRFPTKGTMDDDHLMGVECPCGSQDVSHDAPLGVATLGVVTARLLAALAAVPPLCDFD